MSGSEMLILTPGGRPVAVNVIRKEYPVRGPMGPSLVPLLDESGVEALARCIKERVEHKRDAPVLVTGDPGLGKSTIIMKTARRINPDTDTVLKSIAFRLEEFEQIYHENPMGNAELGVFPQDWMDEAGHAMYGPEWLAKEQRIISKQLIIGRIKKQIVWAAVPKPLDFNNQLRRKMVVWVHVTEPEEYLQGYAIVRTAPAPLQNEFHSDKLWVPKFAFIFRPETGPHWEKYEERKINFVSEVGEETAKGASASSRIIRQRNFLLREYVNYRQRAHNPISAVELADTFPGLGLRHAQISEILASPM